MQTRVHEEKRVVEPLRLGLVFEHVADAIFLAETDGRIIDANPAACRMLGYTREELLSMRPWDFVVNVSREEILAPVEKMQIGAPVSIQRTYRCKGGALREIDLRLARFDSGGRSLVVVSCRDITERKRLEDKLRESEKSLAEGQRLTKTGSWILDYRTGKTDWSVETCRIFGFPDPPPSPDYREFRERVRPEDRDGVDRALRECFETGEPRPMSYLFVLPDGVAKYIETVAQPLRDESGKVVKLMGTVMDVTGRHRAEEALRASEQLARGQLEVLTRTLAALAKETAPDRFLEYVLCTIAGHLGAHSVSVWDRNDTTGTLDLTAVLVGTRLRGLDTVSAADRISISWREHAAWDKLVTTNQVAVLTDVDREHPQVRIGTEEGPPGSALAPPLWAQLRTLGITTVLVVPMSIAGRVAGAIGVRFKERCDFHSEDIELTQALAHQAMMAIQLTRLSEESRHSAVVSERNRMARDIHDTLAQGFTGVIVQLEAAEDARINGLAGEADEHVRQASELARSSLTEARRSVRALRPQALVENELGTAMRELIEKMTLGTGVQGAFTCAGDPWKFPPDWEENVLRVGQEVLTNTLRHARATRFDFHVVFEPGKVRMELSDDGRGFEPAGKHDGFGLIGIRERVEGMGGQLTLTSAPGEGTSIVIDLSRPVASQRSSP